MGFKMSPIVSVKVISTIIIIRRSRGQYEEGLKGYSGLKFPIVSVIVISTIIIRLVEGSILGGLERALWVKAITRERLRWGEAAGDELRGSIK